MNKRIFFLTLYFLIPLLFFIPPIYAVPTITVTYPNGGENLSGTINLGFTVSDSGNSQALSGSLYYSNTPLSFNNVIATDLNYLNYCDFETGILYDTTEFPGYPAWNAYAGHNLSIGSLDGNLNIISYMHIGAADFWKGVYWNGANWIDSPEMVANLPADLITVYPGVEMFEIDSTTYLLASNSTGTLGFKWVTGTGWTAYNDIAAGISTTRFSEIDILDFEGSIIAITKPVLSDDANSWVWNGTSWQSNNYYASLLSATYYAGSYYGGCHNAYFSDNGLIQGLFAYRQMFSTIGGFFDTSVGYWQSNNSYSSDINAIIWGSTASIGYHIHPTVTKDYDGRTIIFVWDELDGTGTTFVLTQEGWLTSTTATCSYPFDTTTANNGLYYFDANVVNSASATASDSGNGKFAIINWTNSDISCTCISNCSSCVLDVNAFVVTPTNESNDVEIKIINGSGSKNVGYRVLNSKNSGKQYKVFDASASDYAGNIWNLNDTITFGSTNYNSIQKIWDVANKRYSYNFFDTILTEETVYYKFEYFEPAYHWFSVNNSDWDVQLPPGETDYNGLSTDFYSVSTYSDLSNFLANPKFPSVSSNLSNKNFVFQFTAKGGSDFSGELYSGIVENRQGTPTTSLNLVSSYKTLSLTNLENGFVSMKSQATTAREIWVQNYAIVERGFFTDSLELFDYDGSPLPVMISDNNTQFKYIVEGKNFLVKTQYNDPDGKIDHFEISAYIDTVDSANKIKKWVFDADSNGLIDISEVIGGLVDLTANADDRTVIVTVRLIDSSENYYEIQTEKIKLRQFPTDRKDLSFSIRQGSQIIGEHPKGNILIETIAPENIIGVNLQFHDMADNNNADFNKTFYKDTDFSCNLFNCNFEYDIQEYIFSASGNFRVDGWVLVTTEEQDLSSPFNDLLHDYKPFIISWLQLDTARIFQTIQRNDHTYRNNEVIPLTLQLRDSTGMPKTLQGKINVKLQLEECDGNVDRSCRNIDVNYSPDSSLFDVTTGYTYYNFRQVFLEETYSPLSDGNYFRVKAIIEDPTRTLETLYIPVLADKCQDPDPLTYLANLFTMDFFGWGCNSGQFTDQIVALPDNNSDEEYLHINNARSVTAPTQYWWMCSSPDQNNLYSDVLAQDVICFTWYLIGESPIDEFKFYLTNKNSDLSLDPEKGQYVEVTVPYDYIYFNDMLLLRETLKQEFHTDWTAANPPSIGETIQRNIDYYLGALAPTINIAGDYLTASGLIGNVGFQMGAAESGNTVDFNFATPLDPRTVSGFITYKLSNLNVINKKNYEAKYPELKTISPSKFVQWADLRNVNIKSDPISVEVFISDHVKVISKESDSKMIIDEVVKTNPINTANADANGTDLKFDSMPTKITFDAISDMIYNNKTTFKRRYLVLPYTLVLDSKTLCGWFGINCWGADTSSGSIVALIAEGDLSFFVVNAFGLFILLAVIVIASVAYRNFRRRGAGG